LKVSKPVIFVLVFAIGVFLYLYVFSGKKQPIPNTMPDPQASQQILPQTLSAITGMPTNQQPDTPKDNPKIRAQVYTKLKNIDWGKDPFSLPGYVEQKLSSQTKDSAKLVAIIEGKNGNVAIIDNEIVKKGDMIGNERIQEIGDGKVVLVNKGAKRVIRVQETPTTDVEIKVKKRGS